MSDFNSILIYFQSVWRSLNFRNTMCCSWIFLSNVSLAIEYSAPHSTCKPEIHNTRVELLSTLRRAVPPKIAREIPNFVVIGKNRCVIIRGSCRQSSWLRFFTTAGKHTWHFVSHSSLRKNCRIKLKKKLWNNQFNSQPLLLFPRWISMLRNVILFA